MPGWPAAAAGAALAAVASAIGTAAWIRFSNRLRVHDEPGLRRLHTHPTPRAGGIAVAFAWWLATALACGWAGADLVSPLPWLLAVTGAFFALGLFDDFRPLGAAPKLLAQLAILAFVFTPLLILPVRNDFILLGLVWLGFLYFVNAWNFMDGSNGMIAMQTVVVAIALAAWPGQDAGLRVAALALAGACIGYLPFNVPGARVFLGDCGSFLLGSALFLMLLASCASGAMHPLQAVLLVSVVLVDTALTLGWRIYRRRTFWKAHREHAYQLAIRKGHSHFTVALAYAFATAGAWLLALSLGREPSRIVQVLIPALAWGCGAAAYIVSRRRWLRRIRPMEGRG